MSETMSVDTQQYEININGHRFSVSSQYEPDHIKNVERFLNERMEEVSRQSDVYSPTKLAVLVALNLADELIASQTTHAKNTTDTENMLRSLCQKLDQALTLYSSDKPQESITSVQTAAKLV